MSVERNFVADLGFALVDPCARDVRQHFALEVFGDVFLERDALRYRAILGRVPGCRFGRGRFQRLRRAR